MEGRVHSFQSLGTVDGPGVRAVLFLTGCPLRCVCCHNPDTWDFSGGRSMSAYEVLEKLLRLVPYFGEKGGLTVSGGEPLMQADFVRELFVLCHEHGINTALDTSGCIMNGSVLALLEQTDLVILDYKYTNAADYKKHTGLEMEKVDLFLSTLSRLEKRCWIRQVIIPGLNDTKESVRRLFALEKRLPCIEKTELLPFRKLCLEKYRELGVDFPLADCPEADERLINELYLYRDN